MTSRADFNQLADDPREARIIDITRILNHDDDQPTSIAAAAESPDDWLGFSARQLCATVGSSAALELLDSMPHHDGGFDWSGIADQDRAKVQVLLELVDRPTPAGPGRGDTIWEILDIADAGMPWVDDEYRTIIWRTLRTLALHPDRPLVRRCKDERLAAAVAWVAMTASNGLVSRGRGRWKTRDLWDWFGVSACTDIGHSLWGVLNRHHVSEELRGTLLNRHRSEPTPIGSAELLHSTYRLALIEQREHLRMSLLDRATAARRDHPIRCDDGRNVQLRSRPVRVRWATRGATVAGRASISLALGDDLADLEILALSIPDARRLIAAIELALEEPMTG